MRIRRSRLAGFAAIRSWYCSGAHTGRGDLLGEGNEFIEAAAAAGDEREPGAAVAEDTVVEIDVANIQEGHRLSRWENGVRPISLALRTKCGGRGLTPFLPIFTR